MNRMNFASRFFYSITSFDKYRLFLRQSAGKAVVYLLLITMAAALFVYIPAGIDYFRLIDDMTANLDTKIPDFRFANGKLSVSGEMPIIIDNGAYPVIIDTSPNSENTVLDQYDIVILITSDKIIQKNYVEKTISDLGAFKGLELTRDDLAKIFPIMKPIGIFVIMLMVLFYIIGKFINALIISLIGLIINKVEKTKLSYRSIFKLSVYSMTLPLIISALLNLFPSQLPFAWLLFYVIASIYLFGAIKTIKKEISYITDNDRPQV